MSRQTDVLVPAAIEPASGALPPIDWASVGHTAPVPVDQPVRKPTDPLPKADVVVITWTNAEWSALDHVFADSGSSRRAGLGGWTQEWLTYSRDTAPYTTGIAAEPLWGVFRVVTVQGATQPWTVLLFRSNAHLQYEPFIAGLRAMVRALLTDTGASKLYSIGTAGGAALNQALGDAVVTNSAELLAGAPPNDSDPANGQTITCAGWWPPTALFAAAQTLMLPLSKVATLRDLETLFSRFSKSNHVGDLTLTDLLNAPLQPANLDAPAVHNLPGVPLNTSCDFAMAPGGGTTSFSAYEEDDAVVGQTAQQLGVSFAFIRNVSDPIVPDHTAAGAPIEQALRQTWAGYVYDRYGLFIASNGAVATWATIAAS